MRAKRTQVAALDRAEQQGQGGQAKSRRLAEQPATAGLTATGRPKRKAAPTALVEPATDDESEASDAGSEPADSDAEQADPAEQPEQFSLSDAQSRAAVLAKLDTSDLTGLKVVTTEQVGALRAARRLH